MQSTISLQITGVETHYANQNRDLYRIFCKWLRKMVGWGLTIYDTCANLMGKEGKYRMGIPSWAQGLAIAAIIYLNDTGRKCELPDIKWMRKARRGTSGTRYRNYISIVAGHNRTDAKMVLLHELAHWALPFKEHHTAAFWDLAWELYRWARLPIKYCREREANYMKGSVAAYARSRAAIREAHRL